ncbi:hypothetical protein EDC01DRAFT_670055 [Geopyxis carbonaria]|nr:hypothetical protein EDC01DRAFT_670055 [Geopyxis carbonaria]
MRLHLLAALATAALAAADFTLPQNITGTTPPSAACAAAYASTPVACSANIASNAISGLDSLCTRTCHTSLTKLPSGCAPLNTIFWPRCMRDTTTGELCADRNYNATTDRWPSDELQRADQLSADAAAAQNATWCAGASCFVQGRWMAENTAGRKDVVAEVREICGTTGMEDMGLTVLMGDGWYDEKGWGEKVASASANETSGNETGATDPDSEKKEDSSSAAAEGKLVGSWILVTALAAAMGLYL